MKEVEKFGYPKKEGWYWLFFPYHYANKPILCWVSIDKYIGKHFYYEWKDTYKKIPLEYKMKSWKIIPEPRSY